MINEILEKHETTIDEVKHVYYNNNADSQMLFISFAGMIDKYVSITWFYNQSNILGHFLFLKNDPEYTTYNETKYETLIEYYIKKYLIKKIIIYGVSMGGIASIKYGLKFNSDLIIAIDPSPINYDIIELLTMIKSYDNNFNYKNKIYINYTFENNLQTIPTHTEQIIKELQLKNFITIIHPFCSTKHLAFIPSKEFLIEIIEKFTTINIRSYTDTNKWF